ncbi:MAG: hypothetical protein ACOYN8_04930 [Pseudanabaena sp.]|jgi:hypothetical protein
MNLNYFFSRLFSKTAFVSLAIITSIFAIASQPVFAESAIATPAAKVETSKADRNHQIDEIAKSPIFLEGKADPSGNTSVFFENYLKRGCGKS